MDRENYVRSLIKYIDEYENCEGINNLKSIDELYFTWRKMVEDDKNMVYIDTMRTDASEIMVEYYERGLDQRKLYNDLFWFAKGINKDRIEYKDNLEYFLREMEKINLIIDGDEEDERYSSVLEEFKGMTEKEIVEDFIERFLQEKDFEDFKGEFAIY